MTTTMASQESNLVTTRSLGDNNLVTSKTPRLYNYKYSYITIFFIKEGKKTYSLGINLLDDFETFKVVKTGTTDNGNLDVVNCIDHCLGMCKKKRRRNQTMIMSYYKKL